jgi:hypothetical protein
LIHVRDHDPDHAETDQRGRNQVVQGRGKPMGERQTVQSHDDCHDGCGKIAMSGVGEDVDRQEHC